jgi:hypothetical protein
MAFTHKNQFISMMTEPILDTGEQNQDEAALCVAIALQFSESVWFNSQHRQSAKYSIRCMVKVLSIQFSDSVLGRTPNAPIKTASERAIRFRTTVGPGRQEAQP